MSPRKVDALVIGAGAAGALCAHTLQKQGHEVVCIHKGGSATRLSSGAFDVADPHKDDVPGEISDPFATSSVDDGRKQVERTHLRHPYARVHGGPSTHAEAANAFFALTADLAWVRADEPDNNVIAFTQLGTAKRTYAVQRGMFTYRNEKTLALVDFADLGAFDAKPVARMLRHMVTLTHRNVDIDVVAVPRVLEGKIPHDATHFARLIHNDEDARARLVDQITLALAAHDRDRFDGVLFPPVFVDDALMVRLTERLGQPCHTVLALPPSAPGERLQQVLTAGLTAAGVQVINGRVTSGLIAGHEVREVTASVGGESVVFAPRAVVLASGRFLSGGLSRERDTREAVFGLPVLAHGREVGERYIGELTGPLPDDEHAIFRAGVGYDSKLRPTDATGTIAAHNLFAAGSVLEGYDPARDGTGLGVCAWTGHRAAAFVSAHLQTAL